MRGAQSLVRHVALQGAGRGIDVTDRHQQSAMTVGEHLGSSAGHLRGDHGRGLGERLQRRTGAVHALRGHQGDVGVVEVLFAGLSVEQQHMVMESQRGDQFAGLTAQRTGAEHPELPARLSLAGPGEGVQSQVDAPVRDQPSGADHHTRRRFVRALGKQHRLRDVAHPDAGGAQRLVLGGGGVALGERDDRVQFAVELGPAGSHRLREPLDGCRLAGDAPRVGYAALGQDRAERGAEGDHHVGAARGQVLSESSVVGAVVAPELGVTGDDEL